METEPQDIWLQGIRLYPIPFIEILTKWLYDPRDRDVLAEEAGERARKSATRRLAAEQGRLKSRC